MIASLLAIFTAILWAIGVISLRKGLEESNAISATLIRTTMGFIIFGVLFIFFVPSESFVSEAVIYHVFAGVISAVIAEQLSNISVTRYGASKAATIVSSRTLFASLAAVIILGEVITLPIGVGTILIVLGVVFLSLDKNDKSGWLDKRLIFPLSCAFFYGIASIPQKIGLDITSSPILGASIEMSSALTVITIYLLLSKQKLLLNRRSISFFSIGGIFGSIGLLSLFYAFSIGTVVAVSPLISIAPLITIVIAYFVLGKLEKITPKLIVSAILVVIGSVLII